MNDFINLSAVENSPEISTALSSSKTGDNSQSAKDKAVVVHVFFSQNKVEWLKLCKQFPKLSEIIY